MEKVKLEILGLSSSQSQSGSFALVMGEENGNRRLPVIIGMFEAQAIAIEIEKISSNRPLTHDLFADFGSAFNYTVREVLINDIREGVFFSKMICTDGTRVVEIDARPSDSIAIGLRFNATIYTYEFIMAEAGIILNEVDHDDEEEQKDFEEGIASGINPFEAGPPQIKKPDRLEDVPSEKLNEMLEEAIRKEDYEKAAQIRDELNRRN